MKNGIIILLCTLFTASCSSRRDSDARQVVNSFFKNYKGDFRTVDRNLVSQSLADLINKAVIKEQSAIAKVAQRNSPTDKPLLLESDIFTSLYEGQDHFNIHRIKIVRDKATITVRFTNSTLRHSWTDEVFLIKKERWYIDNVFYKGNEVELRDTKAVLRDFLAVE